MFDSGAFYAIVAVGLLPVAFILMFLAISRARKEVERDEREFMDPLPFMLRLTNDGISIHGSEVEWGYATHGCIGVPVEFAELLFDLAALGDRVIITQGERITVGDAIAPAQS